MRSFQGIDFIRTQTNWEIFKSALVSLTDNKSLYYNSKVTGESIILFLRENNFKVYQIFITSENDSLLLIMIFIVFRFFSRK